MNFLNPAFLIALAAVSVPLLIHLLSRRRLPEVRFSTLRFLRRSDRRSMRRVNIRRLLLLALRMAGIALLALAFARPVVRGGLAALFPGGGSRTACILLDRSFSMGVEEESGTLFDRARQRLGHVLGNMDGDDEVTVVAFDTAREIVYRGERLEAEAALGSVRDIEVSWGGTDLRGAVAEGLRILASSRREEKELYIISDFQRSGLGTAQPGEPAGMAAGLNEQAGGTGETGKTEGDAVDAGTPAIRAFLFAVRPGTAANVAVERILTPRVTLHRGEVVDVQVALRNSSQELRARFPLQVIVDGRRIIEKEIGIPPGGVRTERLSFPVERTGWVGGEVRKGGDRLAADDRRFFVLHVRERMKVLLIADGEGFYLAQALSPGGSEGDIELVARGWREYTTADLERTEAVVLGPGGGPRAQDIILLDRFVESGGSALVFVIPELERAVRGLSGHAPDISFGRAGEEFMSIARPAADPAVLAPFEEEDVAGLLRVRFRNPPDVHGIPERDVLLAFRSGAPFLWTEERGGGTVAFLCTGPDHESGELALSPYFLPLVQQSVLAIRQERTAGEGSLVGERMTWSGAFGGEPLIGYPDGSGYTPGVVGGGGRETDKPRRGPGGERVLDIPYARQPGFVEIFDGEETVGRIAVNPECSRESRLAGMPPDEAADSLALEHYMVIGERQELAGTLGRARRGSEISLPLLLAATAVFVLELGIAQRRRAGGTDV